MASLVVVANSMPGSGGCSAFSTSFVLGRKPRFRERSLSDMTCRLMFGKLCRLSVYAAAIFR